MRRHINHVKCLHRHLPKPERYFATLHLTGRFIATCFAEPKVRLRRSGTRPHASVACGRPYVDLSFAFCHASGGVFPDCLFHASVCDHDGL